MQCAVSHLLTSHWPQQVTWLSPKSKQGATAEGTDAQKVEIWGHACDLPHRVFRGAEGLGCGQAADEVAEVTVDDLGRMDLKGQ